uniref:DUF3615 domain-containing protein n=1 Tax=Oryza punctata TaxID=4537 RepID=A0A0E0KML1_ORYPU
MAADQIPPTSRTAYGILHNPKKAHLHQEVRRVKRLPRNASKTFWFNALYQKEDSSMCQISEEDSESKKHGCYLAQLTRDLKNGVKELDVETKDKKPVEVGSDHKFGEVLHHCFGAEYRKVYCHYNFTIEMKKNDEACWTSRLFFAEAKLVNGVKTYFCSPLEVTDDGPCYSCKSQLMTDLKHPVGGDYEKVHEPTFIYLHDEDDPDNFELESCFKPSTIAARELQ